LLCLMALLTGCGGPSLGSPTTVTGKVTVDGQPLGNANIVLHYTGEREAEFRTFRGTSDAGGQFKIDKVYPGTYEVLVVEASSEQADPGKAMANPERLAPASGDKLQVEVKPQTAPLDLQLKRQKS
jgi:hypothetical protein